MAKAAAPEKLNICITTHYFPTVGRASDFGFLWPIAKALVKKGHRVTVLTKESPQHVSELKQEGVQIYFLKEGAKSSSWNFFDAVEKKFLELHSKDPFHVLHSVDDSGVKIAIHRKEMRMATIFDVNATQMAQLFAIVGMNKQTVRSILKTGINLVYKFMRTYWGADRRILNLADGVFVSSPMERIILERYYYYPDARIYSVPYGVDMIPHDHVNYDELRQKLNLSNFNQCIVTISDMTNPEEIRSILQAFEQVVIKKPDLRLIIIGEGPRRHDIEFMIYNLALGNKVILTGPLNNTVIPDYIHLADVFININPNSTGFEASLIEAMIQKKVVIGSEVSAMTSIVEDGVDGFLVRPADVNGISELLMNIFNGNLDIQSIGEKAQKKVSDLFDSKKMVQSTLRAYRDLLMKSGFYKSSTFPHYEQNI